MRTLLRLLPILGALLLLQACLTGDKTASTPSPDAIEQQANGLTTEGDQLYLKGQYADAMARYESALQLDSNVSLAYYGYARAVVQYYGVDNIGILNDLDSAAHSASGQIALLNHSDTVLTRRLRAAAAVVKVLAPLIDRDTLSRNYRYLADTGTAARIDSLSDSLFHQRKALMRAYLIQSDLRTPGYRPRKDFPLTDGNMTAKDVLADYADFLIVRAITSTADFDGNGVIDFEHSSDSLFLKLNSP